ncbi:hypothetical protein B296_00017805 [Ensete ventricosum]|uniref:Uncharacterized protein n=1 Tax=Ensete ventricosum TaxID=4639 RepID=A0A427AW37_ENSVE|nr:hypothetical protein B296_00017805 [Ensete ventricosum]
MHTTRYRVPYRTEIISIRQYGLIDVLQEENENIREKVREQHNQMHFIKMHLSVGLAYLAIQWPPFVFHLHFLHADLCLLSFGLQKKNVKKQKQELKNLRNSYTDLQCEAFMARPA